MHPPTVGAHARTLPAEWQAIKGDKVWDSPTNDSLYQALCAWHWLVHWHQSELEGVCTLAQGWLGLLLQHKDCLLDATTGQHALILVPGPWAVLVFDLQVRADGTLAPAATPDPVRWVHVRTGNLDDLAIVLYG